MSVWHSTDREDVLSVLGVRDHEGLTDSDPVDATRSTPFQ